MLFILGFLKSSSSLIAESEETLVFFNLLCVWDTKVRYLYLGRGA